MRYPYWFMISCLCLIILTSCGLDAKPITQREAVDSPGTGEIQTSLSTNLIENTNILTSNSSVAAEPSTNSSTSFLEELEGLVSHRRRNLLASPGWVKRVVRLTIDQDGEQKTTENETSIQIDENGVIIQIIDPKAKCSCQGGVLMSWVRKASSQSIWDMQPQDIWTVLGGSQSDLKKGLLPEPGDRMEKAFEPDQTELSSLTIRGLEPGQPILFDFGFAEYTRMRVAEGERLHRQTIYENCWYLGEQYYLVDQKQRIEALFNPDTGRLHRLQVFDLSQKDIRLVWRIDLAVEE